MIIDLFFSRSENAVIQTKAKYGRLLQSIAWGILKDRQDAEECENDTYMRTWNAIPPTRPNILAAFLSKIVRGLSLDRYTRLHAQKRGGSEIPLLIDELAECIPDKNGLESFVDEYVLQNRLNTFLHGLKKDARMIFMRRYWFGDSIAEISERYNYSASKVKMSLMRTRKELQAVLESEGYAL